MDALTKLRGLAQAAKDAPDFVSRFWTTKALKQACTPEAILGLCNTTEEWLNDAYVTVTGLECQLREQGK